MDFFTTDRQKLRKTLSTERRPLMLKDYLRDDLSSCSSSGFKLFSRRQSCTTIRFLLEIDLKSAKDSHKYNTKRLLQRSRSKAASKTISALQRASEALLHAVKQLPFPSVKSPSLSVQHRSEKGLLLRNLSRKPLKRSFWRKADIEEHTIKRWKMFREYLEEQHQPSDHNIRQNPTTSITTVSTCCGSKSNSISNSLTESDLTADILQSSTSSGNSGSSSENDGVESKKDVPSSGKKLVSDRVGVSVGENSITITNSEENTKDWRNEEDKEQFSPVSVLDCPFEDEKHINSPPLEHRLACMEGTKQKLMQKLRRFESLAQLEPVHLEKRIASSELQLDEENEISVQSYSLVPVLDNNPIDEENETNMARELLKIVKSKTPSNTSYTCKAADNLLSDFFTEKITENNNQKMELLKEARDWINGKPKELLMGWGVEEGRKAYVNHMEKNGKWRIVNAEKEDVGLALDVEVFTSLINELVLDLFY